jgi:hypothetical protein
MGLGQSELARSEEDSQGKALDFGFHIVTVTKPQDVKINTCKTVGYANSAQSSVCWTQGRSLQEK